MSTRFYIATSGEPTPVGAVYISKEGGPIKAKVGIISEGYPSISDMLGASPFYVAHRGGSMDWDEMTMRAYTNSVAWGAGALEVSVARSSDGVWFGLHDEYLDRTSQEGTGTTHNPKTMTWAEIQEQEVFGREPYMPLIDLLQLYGDTHVIFVDPKYVNRLSHNAELWSLIKAHVPAWATRVIIKLYWNFNSGWGANAKAAGFTTWGYLWDDDGYTEIMASSSNHSNFDLLGLNYDGGFPAWSDVLSIGKPVIGHVCPDSGAAGLALSYGAVGVMAAGVKSIIPSNDNLF